VKPKGGGAITLQAELFYRNVSDSYRLLGQVEDILKFFEGGKADLGTVKELSKEALGYLSRARKLLDAMRAEARERESLSN